jgi:hypothetical protein
MTTLIGKISRYQLTLERSQHRHNVCFVVPGEHRAHRLCQEGRQDARKVPGARFWVTTTYDLEAAGPLGDIWRCLDHADRPRCMADFETLNGVEVTPRGQALGRRWQVPISERWAMLSPFRALSRPQDTPAAVAAEDAELAREWEQRRAQERTEAKHDAKEPVAGLWGGEGLRSDGGSGLLDHPQAHEEEEPLR